MAVHNKTDWPREPADEGAKRYFIDKAWHRQRGRSLAALVQSRLCQSCQAKPLGEDEVLDNVERCCSRTDGFITPGQPLQERVFRLLLAKGGQPMSLSDMLKELKRRGGVGLVAVSPRALDRILGRDTFYGIRPV
ncbi:MAG: hypothetical protein HY669_03670 [Chloroflexi bacterium]|nr:hypothetical protein [Chloroflexota bacterium]